IVAGRVRGAEYVGTVNVGDRGWEHYDNGDDWRALVDEGEGMTVVLSGPTTLDEFAVLAESLQALPEEEGEADDESDDEGDEEEDEEDSDDAGVGARTACAALHFFRGRGTHVFFGVTPSAGRGAVPWAGRRSGSPRPW